MLKKIKQLLWNDNIPLSELHFEETWDGDIVDQFGDIYSINNKGELYKV